jgi:tRNA 2-thiouridine synthesizing protein A
MIRETLILRHVPEAKPILCGLWSSGKEYIDMVEVDARGLSCPEPIMLTAEALKNEKGPIKVLVSEPVQKENVEKYAKSQGKKPTSKEVGDEFEIVIE